MGLAAAQASLDGGGESPLEVGGHSPLADGAQADTLVSGVGGPVHLVVVWPQSGSRHPCYNHTVTGHVSAISPLTSR